MPPAMRDDRGAQRLALVVVRRARRCTPTSRSAGAMQLADTRRGTRRPCCPSRTRRRREQRPSASASTAAVRSSPNPDARSRNVPMSWRPARTSAHSSDSTAIRSAGDSVSTFSAMRAHHRRAGWRRGSSRGRRRCPSPTPGQPSNDISWRFCGSTLAVGCRRTTIRRQTGICQSGAGAAGSARRHRT